MLGAIADVADFKHETRRNRVLRVEVPIEGSGRGQVGIYADERNGRGRRAQERIEGADLNCGSKGHGKRGRRVTGSRVSKRRGNRGFTVPGIEEMLAVDQLVEYSRSAPNYETAGSKRLPCESKARSEIGQGRVAVGIEIVGAAKNARRYRTLEILFHRETDIRTADWWNRHGFEQRPDRVGATVAGIVVTGAVIFPAQAQVQREPRRDFEIILGEETEVVFPAEIRIGKQLNIGVAGENIAEGCAVFRPAHAEKKIGESLKRQLTARLSAGANIHRVTLLVVAEA